MPKDGDPFPRKTMSLVGAWALVVFQKGAFCRGHLNHEKVKNTYPEIGWNFIVLTLLRQST